MARYAPRTEARVPFDVKICCVMAGAPRAANAAACYARVLSFAVAVQTAASRAL